MDRAERWRMEGASLLARAANGEISAGNSIVFAFKKDFAKENNLSSLGRCTIGEGDVVYHGAPRKVQRETEWTSHVQDFVSDVELFRAGGDAKFPMRAKPPSFTYNRLPTGMPHRYEPKLLRYISEGGDLTLVNPSIGTVFRCEFLKRVHIYFTANSRVKYQDIYDTLVKIKRTDIPIVDTVQGTAYLGSNGVNLSLDCPWVALTPNPFMLDFPYLDYSVKFGESIIEMQYQRKGRTQYCNLEVEPKHYRYSPSQVDNVYFDHIKTGGDGYFLESNIAWPMPYTEEKGDPIAFLSKFPEYIDGVSFDETYVYDCQGLETVLSRRRLLPEIAKRLGLAVAPLETEGLFALTLSSLNPSLHHFPDTWDVAVDTGGVASFFAINGGADLGSLTDTYGGVAFIYGDVLTTGSFSTKFPRGSVIKVPYNPQTQRFYFLPTIPGKYFFFRKEKDLSVFQVSILNELYGGGLRSRIGYRLPNMHPNLKLNTEVSGVVGNLPIVDKFGEGGISINELSDRFSIPFPLVRSSLQQCDWVVKFRRGGREYFTNINRVRHMVETPDGFQTLSILWYNWRYKGKVDILREVDVEFISDFFFLGREFHHFISEEWMVA